MTTPMRELGIDRMSVAQRVELALDIWESLEGEVPCAPLSVGGHRGVGAAGQALRR